jgi:hypothetical protein
VTLTVSTLLCPDASAVGDPVNDAICCPEPVGVVSVPVSSLLPPQAVIKKSMAKEISSNNVRENLVLIDFIILISFL